MFEQYREKHGQRVAAVDRMMERARANGATGDQLFSISRLKGLGGSDMAVLTGHTQYRTRYALWLDKRLDVRLRDQTLPMRFGHWNEEFVATLYRERTGLSLSVADTFVDDAYPYLPVNFDRIVHENGKAAWILECKTTAHNSTVTLPDGTQRPKWGREDMAEIDPAYYPQVQLYLALSRMPWCDVAVLIGNSDFRVYRVEPNPGFITKMLAEAEGFWCVNVLDGIEPERVYEEIRQDPGNDSVVEADTALQDLVQKAREAGTRARAAQKEYDDIKAEIAKAMGDSAEATCRDPSGAFKTLVTFRGFNKTVVDTDTLKSEMPDVYEKYKKEVSVRRTLRIY